MGVRISTSMDLPQKEPLWFYTEILVIENINILRIVTGVEDSIAPLRCKEVVLVVLWLVHGLFLFIWERLDSMRLLLTTTGRIQLLLLELTLLKVFIPLDDQMPALLLTPQMTLTFTR